MGDEWTTNLMEAVRRDPQLKATCILLACGLTVAQIAEMRKQYMELHEVLPQAISLSLPGFSLLGMRVVITSSGERVRIGDNHFGTTMDFPLPNEIPF